MSEQNDWIQAWIDKRLGVDNAFNKQLLVDFEKEVRKLERERIANAMVFYEENEAPSFEGSYYALPSDEWQALKEEK